VLLGASEGLADCVEFLEGVTELLPEAAEFTFLELLSTRLLPEE